MQSISSSADGNKRLFTISIFLNSTRSVIYLTFAYSKIRWCETVSSMSQITIVWLQEFLCLTALASNLISKCFCIRKLKMFYTYFLLPLLNSSKNLYFSFGLVPSSTSIPALESITKDYDHTDEISRMFVYQLSSMTFFGSLLFP